MRNLLYLIPISIIILGLSTPVHALTVSPVKAEISADPGQSVTEKIELFNEQSEAITFFTSFENFESRGDSGAPYFTGADTGLATWISSVPEIRVEPGKRVEVPYSITVPPNARPGGHFAAVFFGTQPPATTSGGEVSIGGKVGVLILLRVNGEVDESAGLSNFFLKDGSRIVTKMPAIFEFSFNNTGGDRVVPKGEIKIRNTIRMKSATLLANEHEGSVLPNSTRRFETVWGELPTVQNDPESKESPGFFGIVWNQIKDFHFGWYTANLNLAWGTTVQTAESTYHFFIIPWQLIVVVLVVVFVFGFLLKKGLKRYNRYIIAQSRKQR